MPFYTVPDKLTPMGAWDARAVAELRAALGLTQAEFARALGVRQQTVSEWEQGQYLPRGASARLLSIIADRSGFKYDAGKG